jgi:hypothetical protein
MLLESVKWLPGVQNDSSVINTPESLDSLVANTPGSLDSSMVNTCWGVSTPLCSTHWGVDFLVYLEQASEQVYGTTFCWQIDQGVKNLQCIHRGVLTPWCILHDYVLFLFFVTNFGWFPGVFITREFRLPSDGYQCCGAENICFGSSSGSDLRFVGTCFHSF